MKKIFISLFIAVLMTSCFDVEQVDNSKIKDELKLTKPMKISAGELMAVAQEIGDSLVGTIPVNNDDKYELGLHQVIIASKGNDTLTNGILKDHFEAFEYQVDNGLEIKSDVTLPKRSDFAHYFTAKQKNDSTLALVAIQINVKDVTIKIANNREAEKKK